MLGSKAFDPMIPTDFYHISIVSYIISMTSVRKYFEIQKLHNYPSFQLYNRKQPVPLVLPLLAYPDILWVTHLNVGNNIEITLVTCTDDSKGRIVVKAKV